MGKKQDNGEVGETRNAGGKTEGQEGGERMREKRNEAREEEERQQIIREDTGQRERLNGKI